MSEQSFEQAVRESRIFYRRNLAKALAVALIKKPYGGQNEFQDPAAKAEDFANAVTERLVAREEQELAKIEDLLRRRFQEET